MSVEQLLADIRHDQETIAAAASNLGPALVRINALTRALARLGCSCTQKTRETDLEAHERFCQFRMAIEDITDVVSTKAKSATGGNSVVNPGSQGSSADTSLEAEIRAAQVRALYDQTNAWCSQHGMVCCPFHGSKTG